MNVIYDIESFPNFFSVCFYDIDTKEFRDFVIHESRNDITKLRRYFNKVDWIIGFNNEGYDNIIMQFVMGADNVSPETINRLSMNIIETRRGKESLYKNSIVKPWLKKYRNSIDLMSMHALHKIGVSLKQVGVILKHDKIQDLPKDPTGWVRIEEIDEILKYGRNDVVITKLLYDYSIDDLKLRHSVGRQYGVNVLSGSRTYIAKEIFNKYYEEHTKIPLKDFKDLRTYYKKLYLGKIVERFDFKTKPLQELYERIVNTVVDANYKLSDKVSTKVMTHTIGMGGLHSKNKNEIYEEDDTYALLDVDFASYYPNLMLKYKIYPRHLRPEFLTVLESLTSKRLAAKKSGDNITADTLKISINSVFGLTGFDNYWLKDDRVMYQTTLNGQLLLLQVIEFIEGMGDVECIYSNTDGATFKVNKKILGEVTRTVTGIGEKLGIELEHVLYKKMIIKDVNNYLIVKDKDDIKIKGAFLYAQDITKGFRHPVVTTALYEYYVNDTPIADTINNHKDIYDFCIAQKTGRQFTTYYRTVKETKKIQKTNRYFVSTTSGSLVKVKELPNGDRQENQAVAGENVYILNDYDKDKLDYYLSIVKKSWYIKEANKIVNSFVKSQLKLF